MKTYYSCLSVLIISCMTSFVGAQSANDFYQRGVQAMNRGEVEAAETAFKKALKVKPNHAYARYQLGQLKLQAGQLETTRREKAFAAVTLEEVKFSEVPFSDAVMALGQMVETSHEANKDKDKEGAEAPVMNFVIQDPAGKLGERLVSLQMKQIPAKTALDYLLKQVQAVARYDEHAIVIRAQPTE